MSYLRRLAEKLTRCRESATIQSEELTELGPGHFRDSHGDVAIFEADLPGPAAPPLDLMPLWALGGEFRLCAVADGRLEKTLAPLLAPGGGELLEAADRSTAAAILAWRDQPDYNLQLHVAPRRLRLFASWRGETAAFEETLRSAGLSPRPANLADLRELQEDLRQLTAGGVLLTSSITAGELIGGSWGIVDDTCQHQRPFACTYCFGVDKSGRWAQAQLAVAADGAARARCMIEKAGGRAGESRHCFILPFGAPSTPPRRHRRDRGKWPTTLDLRGDLKGNGGPLVCFTRRGGLASLNLHDPAAPSRNWLLTGSGGSGKSFFLSRALFSIRRQGVPVRLLDTYGGHLHTSRIGLAENITFSYDTPASLNPLALAGTPGARAILADMLASLLSLDGDQQSSLAAALEQAVDQALDSGESTIAGLLKHLELPELAALADKARELLAAFSGPLAPFGSGAPQLDAPFLIWNIEQLRPRPEFYHLLNILAMATLALDMINSGSHVAIEEAWMFYQAQSTSYIPITQRLLDTADSSGGAVCIVTQSPLDLAHFDALGPCIVEKIPTRIYLEGPDFVRANGKGSLPGVDTPLELELAKSIKSNRPRYSELFITAPWGRGVLRTVAPGLAYWLASSDHQENAIMAELVTGGHSQATIALLLHAERWGGKQYRDRTEYAADGFDIGAPDDHFGDELAGACPGPWSAEELRVARYLAEILCASEQERTPRALVGRLTACPGGARRAVAIYQAHGEALVHRLRIEPSGLEAGLYTRYQTRPTIQRLQGQLAILLAMGDAELAILDQVDHNLRLCTLVSTGVIDLDRARLLGEVVRHDAELEHLTPNPLFDRLLKRHPWHAWQLYLGHRPAALANGELTRAEAHQWIVGMANARGEEERGYRLALPLHWLAYSLGIPSQVFERLRCRDRETILWVAAKLPLTALTKRRRQQLPGGIWQEYSFLDLLDEVRIEDLAQGRRSNVDKVFKRVADRQVALYEEAALKDLPLPPAPFPPPPATPEGEIEYLDSTYRLWAEGKQMSHCVAGYSRSCLAGNSAIYAVRTPSGRTTFELYQDDGHWRLTQHRAFRNGKPYETNDRLVRAWANRHGIAIRTFN